MAHPVKINPGRADSDRQAPAQNGANGRLHDQPRPSPHTLVDFAEIRPVPGDSLAECFATDPTFADWRPHHVTMARLRITLKEPIDFAWLTERRFGSYPALLEWIQRYATVLEATFRSNEHELKALHHSWLDVDVRPSASTLAVSLHEDLVKMREVSQEIAQGRFLLPPEVYASVSLYEQQRAIALSVARSWCTHNGLPLLFDGLAIIYALSLNGSVEPVEVHGRTPEERDFWAHVAAAPFIMPTGIRGNTGQAVDDDHAYSHCLIGEHLIPVNYGYPLPAPVFEDYARLCYRIVINEHHPSYARSERYSPHSNVILAWYFQKGLSVAEIARRLQIAKSTAQRQLELLIELFNRDLPENAAPLRKRQRDGE